MDRPFRIIVVGGGVAGLAASHCLQKAGIDHVVLEKHAEVAPAEGASITIYPHVVRILHQLGCLEAIAQCGVPHDRAWTRRSDGSIAGNSGLFNYLKENHGYDVLPLERREFLRVLYETLPNKNLVRTGSAIQQIKHLDDKVEVTLRDGSVETGDMVLGCDGVHSTVRSLMWQYAEQTAPGLITEAEKNAFVTYWKCLIGIGPPPDKSVGGKNMSDFTLVHDTRYSFLVLAQPHCTFFFVLFFLNKPFPAHQRVRYTEQDAEALAATVADHPLSESWVFGDLWNNRSRGALISLEEGVLEHWHHERIVLAGDAVHKMTPNIALGGNTAIEDVVVLCNHVHRMLQRQGGTRPDLSTLNHMFAAYQTERLDRTKFITNISGMASRAQAQTSPLYKLAAWLMPRLPDRGASDQLAGLIKAAPKVEFVPVQDFAPARVPWEDRKETGQQQKGRQDGSSSLWQSPWQLLTLGATLGVATIVLTTRWAQVLPVLPGALSNDSIS
ncbi:uncharacterized protein BCR38DRAFT_332111 [Pseudomassariella vexata]|uniref:FAD-binding domain-containing protein n=1 Tax=Pseudomassariella vexata TaxID=1141098 RepID=A0A1Y2EE64_9PEZI|nr:uncharacterized protein BCR38DRAFT_332111 [Pseudomassariella vexata]ORY69604.1 hypothetical protein BCR38DRAFT_332111 [Pseudomassariella vexata]